METTTEITLPLSLNDIEFICAYYLGKAHNKELDRDERDAAAHQHLMLYKKLDREKKENVRHLADQLESDPQKIFDAIIKQLRELREKYK